MIAAAIAASSAREMALVVPTPLGFTQWDTIKQGGIHLILRLALLCVFKTTISQNLVLYRSGLGWSCV
jgi:hypothetical protein